MNRRYFLNLLTALLGYLVTFRARGAQKPIPDIQNNWRTLLPKGARIPAPTDRLALTDAAWMRQLTPEQYRVMRHEATERPFTSPLNDELRPGAYLCAACDLPLFTSEMKFDAGTGWPSFFTCIPDALETREDSFLFYATIEYHCSRCGGHQGHLFDDGPRPTRERWCNNGVALRFLASDI